MQFSNKVVFVPILAATSLLVGACSTAPAEREVAAELAAEVAPAGAPTDVKVVRTSAQAAKYLTEDQLKEARRACLRKARRITGSRIPRNACAGSGSMYTEAPHIRGAEDRATGGIPTP